jgi:chromosome segregation ATPase
LDSSTKSLKILHANDNGNFFYHVQLQDEKARLELNLKSVGDELSAQAKSLTEAHNLASKVKLECEGLRTHLTATCEENSQLSRELQIKKEALTIQLHHLFWRTVSLSQVCQLLSNLVSSARLLSK